MLKVILHLLGMLPFRLRSRLGYFLGGLVGLLPLRDQKIAVLQLRKFHPSVSAPLEVRRVFGHFARVGLESIHLLKERERIDQLVAFEDLEFARSLVNADRPTLFLSAHFGNWELMAGSIRSLGTEVVTVAREARKASIHSFLRKQRAQLGVETIWRGGSAGKRELLEAFKAGRTIAALIDQDTRVSGIDSEFLGHHVVAPSALISLALRKDAQIVTAFSYRAADGMYHIRAQSIKEKSTAEVLRVYHQRLEVMIHKYPEQWVWFHKRWRTLPDKTRLSATEYEQFLKGG